MIKTIPISKLSIGMYVENVVKQKGRVRIKSSGLVKTQSTLDLLKKKGILELEINLERSNLPTLEAYFKSSVPSAKPNDAALSGADEENIALENETIGGQVKTAATKGNDYVRSEVEHLADIANADKLYTQAKSVQKNFVTQLRSGSTPNLSEISDLSQNIIDSVFDNVDALSCLMMLKDSNEYLVEHAINCAILLAMFAQAKGMSPAEVEDLTMAGLLMDIGMASLPNDLLAKTTEFSEADWTLIRSHVDIGIELVERLDDVSPIVLDVIANHHERVDGSGYPEARNASAISIYAQMAGIVDSYDALISNRSYRCSSSATVGLSILEKDKSLNKDLVNEFINAIGLHPVGSLVHLDSQKLACVSQRNPSLPLEPIVIVFYHLQTQEHSGIERIDLSQSDDHIVNGVRPEEFNVNLGQFFQTAFLPK